jgi:hypothetical protein
MKKLVFLVAVLATTQLLAAPAAKEPAQKPAPKVQVPTASPAKPAVPTKAAPPAALPRVALPSVQIPPSPPPTRIEVGQISVKLEDAGLTKRMDEFERKVSGRIDALGREVASVKKEVASLKVAVEQNGKKLDQVLTALGPMSQWVQEQRKEAKEAQAKKAAPPKREEISHLVWDSDFGECHVRLNAGKLETKLVSRGQTEWSSLHSISNGWLYAICGNTYYRLGDYAWLMGHVRKYHYACQ